jgi:hypothetical protein
MHLKPSTENNMSEKISAQVRETNNGAYYNVLLSAVPQKGEYITLHSHLDQSTGHMPTHNYEVVDVIHEIQDVTDKAPQTKDGKHSVIVIVRKSSSGVFN